MSRYTAPRFKSGKGKSVRVARLKRRRDKEQKKKLGEIKKKIGLVSLLCISFLFFIGFFFYKKANKSFASADSYKSTYLSEDMYPTFSYVVVEDFDKDPVKLKKIEFVILDRESKKVLIYDVPLDVSIEVPGKFSSSEFSKVFALGGLNSKDSLIGGIDLVNLSLFKLFAFKVDNFILVDNTFEHDLDRFVYEGKSFVSLSNFSDLKNSFKTNLSLSNFYKTHLFLKSLPSDRYIRRNLTKEHIQDPTFLDDDLRDLTLSSNISSEKKTISVLNGTDFGGIAHLGSRVARNIGGRVVGIDNSSSSYKESMIVADDLNSTTVKFLSYVFKIENILSKSELPDIKDEEFFRSDVILILGFDLAERLY